LRGLSVSLPAALAVSSPHHKATTPWLISCNMTAGINTSKKMNVSLLNKW
jgi:hypothetical protein